MLVVSFSTANNNFTFFLRIIGKAMTKDEFYKARNEEIFRLKSQGKHNIWIGVKVGLSASRVKAILREMSK